MYKAVGSISYAAAKQDIWNFLFWCSVIRNSNDEDYSRVTRANGMIRLGWASAGALWAMWELHPSHLFSPCPPALANHSHHQRFEVTIKAIYLCNHSRD